MSKAKVFYTGDIVWIRTTGLPWWPGFVCDVGIPGKKGIPTSTSVLWFGDHCMSQENQRRLKCFKSSFKECYSSDGNGTYISGVLEAVEVIAERTGYVSRKKEDLIWWSSKGFPANQCKDEPKPDKVPNFLKDILDQVVGKRSSRRDGNSGIQVRSERDSSPESNSDEEYKDDFDPKTEELMKLLERGKVQLQDVCLGCQKAVTSASQKHPVFDGGLCSSCKEEFACAEFAIESESGMHLTCQVCSSTGYLLYCENAHCRRASCEFCLSLFCSVDPLESSFYKDPGLCLLCAPYEEETHGKLKIRKNWRKQMDQLLHPGDGLLLDAISCKPDPLSVLCCFDSRKIAQRALEPFGAKIKSVDIYQPVFFENNRIGRESDSPELSNYDLTIACIDEQKLYIDMGGRELDESAAQLAEFYRLLQESRSSSLYVLLQLIPTQADSSKFITRFLNRYPFQLKHGLGSRNPYWLWSNIPGLEKDVDGYEDRQISIWEERSVPSKVLRKKCFGPSMEPTIYPEDVIVAECWSPRLKTLRTGDIVIARSPRTPQSYICKRIAAMPGEKVHAGLETNYVPRGHVWLEGDNKSNSKDSRFYGPVPEALIHARAVAKIWPLDDVGIFERRKEWH